MNIQIIENILKFDNEIDLNKAFSLLANQYIRKEVSIYKDDLRYDSIEKINYEHAKSYSRNFKEVITQVECNKEYKAFGKKSINTYIKDTVTYSFDYSAFNCNDIYSDSDLLSIIFLDKKIDLKYIKKNLLENI